MSGINEKALGAGLAGGAIAVAMLETLVEKNILSVADARNVLGRALTISSQYSTIPEGREAMATIGILQHGRFPQSG
jgi:hypothetical protein